jgi:hypothetical protein
MQKDIEKIVGSSLDNFLILESTTPTILPTVKFTVKGFSDVNIQIIDNNNPEWQGLTLTGTSTGTITQNSFITKNNTIETGLSLVECLKKNPLFFGFKTPKILANNDLVIECFIEMNNSYSLISSDTNVVEISTSGDSFNIIKYIIDMNITTRFTTSNLTLEKYSVDNEISFNLTSPFSTISEKYPIHINLFGYKTDGTSINLINLNVNEFDVLPTTLHKFDYVDFYGEYFKDKDVPDIKLFLSNNFNRSLNYGEMISFSFLSDDPNLSILARFYTNSGRFLKSQNEYLAKDFNYVRSDFYIIPQIEEVERQYNTQVGYILYNIVDSAQNILSNNLRFDVIPNCNENKVFYFVNELGGIDSFNFLGELKTDYSISDQITFNSTPTRPFTNNKVIERVNSKAQEINYIIKTTLINKETAEWLNELNKSKYVFFMDNEKNETRIIVDKFDIEISNETKQYELTMTYHISDNRQKI